MGKKTGAGNGREVKGEGDRGEKKGKAGGKGEHAEGDRKEGRGMELISLPHGRLKTLAALIIVICMHSIFVSILSRSHSNEMKMNSLPLQQT